VRWWVAGWDFFDMAARQRSRFFFWRDRRRWRRPVEAHSHRCAVSFKRCAIKRRRYQPRREGVTRRLSLTGPRLLISSMVFYGNKNKKSRNLGHTTVPYHWLVNAGPQMPSRLTEEDAVEIYGCKLTFVQSMMRVSRRAKRIKAKNEWAALGKRYNVSPKAIRDIWVRRTWVLATLHLWELG
jgi:hypothetical protein